MEAPLPDGRDPATSSGRPWIRALVLAVVVAALAVRWTGSRSGEGHELAGTTMGTSYRVRIDAEMSDAELERARAIVQDRLDRIEGLLTTYDPASELSRFNRHASTDPYPASTETIEVVRIAREVAERSGGALDVTVAPLVEAWGFGVGSGLDGTDVGPPSDAELERIRTSVGYDRIRADPAAGTLTKTDPTASIDLSGVAKGYAAEEVSAGLRGLGLTRFLVEVGGELAAVGTPHDGSEWRVGIELPSGAPGIWGAISIVDAGVATSGDYRDFYEVDGVRYAHIVDPRTGRPVPVRGASVSVVHPSAAVADAWATALMVLGPDEGYDVATREGLAALFIFTTGGVVESLSTDAMRDRLTRLDGAAR